MRMSSKDALSRTGDGPGGFAIAAVREDGKWRCSPLDSSALGGLDAAMSELRRLRSTGAVFGMLGVDDEFFILLRPTPRGVSALLSDAAAGLYYDVAADVLELLRAEPPEEDDESVWPAGDVTLLADLGLVEEEMQVIVDDLELYPDEQLAMIARSCGFAEQFDAVLDRASS
jgi:putative tRNA adenosine deaminase-associated protein